MRVLLGVLRLAIGRGGGASAFANTPQSYLNSLVPLLALPIAVGLYLAAVGHLLAAVALVLVVTVAQLAPAVLSFELLRFWGRDALWCRYAAAWNWCQWMIPVATFVLCVVVFAVETAVAPATAANPAALQPQVAIILALYGLALNLIVARHGLEIGWGRALALALLVNAGTGALLFVPDFVQALVEGSNGSAP